MWYKKCLSSQLYHFCMKGDLSTRFGKNMVWILTLDFYVFYCIVSVNFLFFVFCLKCNITFILYLYFNLFLSGGPTLFSFYAIVVVSLNKIFQFQQIFNFQNNKKWHVKTYIHKSAMKIPIIHSQPQLAIQFMFNLVLLLSCSLTYFLFILFYKILFIWWV